MSGRWRRGLSFFVSASMVLSLVPTPALAEATDELIVQEVEEEQVDAPSDGEDNANDTEALAVQDDENSTYAPGDGEYVDKYDLLQATITLSSTELVLVDGEAAEPEVTVTDAEGNVVDPSEYQLQYGDDYSGGTGGAPTSEGTYYVYATPAGGMYYNETDRAYFLVKDPAIADVELNDVLDLTVDGENEWAGRFTAPATGVYDFVVSYDNEDGLDASLYRVLNANMLSSTSSLK